MSKLMEQIIQGKTVWGGKHPVEEEVELMKLLVDKLFHNRKDVKMTMIWEKALLDLLEECHDETMKALAEMKQEEKKAFAIKLLRQTYGDDWEPVVLEAEKVDDENEEDDWQEECQENCQECGGIFFQCKHTEGKTDLCTGGCNNKLAFRCFCYKCLFDGTVEYDDQWDSLKEVLDGIAFKMLKIGETDTELYPLTSKDKDVKKLYKLYKYGYSHKSA
jgi:hypothetical protein